MDQPVVHASDHERKTIYTPTCPPHFAAWVTAFDYGDGRIGISFKEQSAERDPDYRPPKLELGEAVGAPVSYCSAECGDEELRSYRVYMISNDGGATFQETGRCPLHQGSFLNIGFPDGRMIGLDVGRINEAGTGWCDFIALRESTDGGSTWVETDRLLPGCSVYLWRLRRLQDGSFLVLASLYGTPWGKGCERMTRNTMLPGETYLSKIQTFFLHSRDGRSFSGPHYILPGIGAHEYDAVELENGDLLFIAGDVQATPVGRQIVRRTDSGFINGPLMPIRRGAPPDPVSDPQGGFVPETVCCLPGNILVGARRNKTYSCSGDLGANWYEIDGLPTSLYQPFLQLLPDGSLMNFGHFGGDSAIGQVQMYIGADRFRLAGTPPLLEKLSLQRVMNDRRYVNAYKAVLTRGGSPAPGRDVTFRITPFWTADGSVSTLSQEQAPMKITVVTDDRGEALAKIPAYDRIRDIHFAYIVDAVCSSAEDGVPGCSSPMMTVLAMTPCRNEPYPYDAYFAEGTLFVAPRLVQCFPDIFEQLSPMVGHAEAHISDPNLCQAMEETLVLTKAPDGTHRWIDSIHAPSPLASVLPMGSGDHYI